MVSEWFGGKNLKNKWLEMKNLKIGYMVGLTLRKEKKKTNKICYLKNGFNLRFGST